MEPSLSSLVKRIRAWCPKVTLGRARTDSSLPTPEKSKPILNSLVGYGLYMMPKRSATLGLATAALGFYFFRYIWSGIWILIFLTSYLRIYPGTESYWPVLSSYYFLLGGAGLLLAVLLFPRPQLDQLRAKLVVLVSLLWGVEWFQSLAFYGHFARLLVDPISTLLEPSLHVLTNTSLGLASIYLAYSTARNRNLLVPTALLVLAYSFDRGYSGASILFRDIILQRIKAWTAVNILRESYYPLIIIFMLAALYCSYQVLRTRNQTNDLRLPASIALITHGAADITYVAWACFAHPTDPLNLLNALVVRLPLGSALMALGIVLLSTKLDRWRAEL